MYQVGDLAMQCPNAMNAWAERKQASSPDHVQGRKKIIITEKKERKNGKIWKENEEKRRGGGGQEVPKKTKHCVKQDGKKKLKTEQNRQTSNDEAHCNTPPASRSATIPGSECTYCCGSRSFAAWSLSPAWYCF